MNNVNILRQKENKNEDTFVFDNFDWGAVTEVDLKGVDFGSDPFAEEEIKESPPQQNMDIITKIEEMLSNNSMEIILAKKVKIGEVSIEDATKICKSLAKDISILRFLIDNISLDKLEFMIIQISEDVVFLGGHSIAYQIERLRELTDGEEEFNVSPQLPLFPTDVFPKNLKEFIESLSESLQVPVDVPSVLVFPAIAAMSMRKFKVSPRAGWIEEVCVYSGVLASPGSKKSAVFSQMVNPIKEIQKVIMSNQRVKRAEYESNRKILSKKIEKLENELIKLNDTEAINNCTALKSQLIKELSGQETVSEGQMIVEDITPEALVTTLVNNNEQISLFSPEGGFVTGMLGRYSSDPNIDIYLKAIDGESHIVTRTSKKEYLDNPCLNIGALFQPSVVKDFTDYATSRGLPQRFLLVKPKYNIGYENLHSAPVPEELVDGYKSLLKGIYDLDGCTLTFDFQALEEFNKLRAEIQKQMRKGELFGDSHYCEWMNKLAGKIARLLALIHIADNYDKTNFPREISLETAKKAWNLYSYYAEHYLAIYGRQKETLSSNAKLLVNYILKHSLNDVIEWRNIQQSNLKRRMNSKEMKAVIQKLEKLNLIRTDQYNDKLFHILPEMKQYL